MQTFASASDKSGSAKTFFAATLGTATQIKATPGQIYYLGGLNLNAATVFLQIFFKPSASVTLGTTVADFTIAIATSGAFSISFTVPFGFPPGAALGQALATPVTATTGLTIAATTTATGSTTGSVALTALYL